ncbi:MAG: hypothetical protein QCI38_07740, partial [Candidatus Thermoplasmatota archaeon]|nr:hypothetical protein [Candidatus Thermoplasmatota archaeon]
GPAGPPSPASGWSAQTVTFDVPEGCKLLIINLTCPDSRNTDYDLNVIAPSGAKFTSAGPDANEQVVVDNMSKNRTAEVGTWTAEIVFFAFTTGTTWHITAEGLFIETATAPA